MTRKDHNHTLQTNPRHHEDETQNTNSHRTKHWINSNRTTVLERTTAEATGEGAGLNFTQNNDFTLLIFIPFPGIGEWYFKYFKCVLFILKFNLYLVSCFWCHKCDHDALMKEAKGQNKLFQNAALLMCYCRFAIGQSSLLKNQFESYRIVVLSSNQPGSPFE